MINYFENLISLPNLFSTLAKGLKQQKLFMQHTIAKDLEEIKKNLDNSLTEKDFKKITDYYGSAVPAILGEGFCILRGYGMTKRERFAMTYLGALTGVFDDFFDEKNAAIDHVKNLIDNPIEASASNSHELLFVRFINKALENTNEIDVLKHYVSEVIDAQILSKRQNETEIERKEIKEITLLKGGVSFLYYRCALGKCDSKTEEKLLYKLGGMSQLENDIFDVYKDYCSGTRTLATIETKINNLRIDYTVLKDEIFELVRQTNFPAQNKKRFLRFISLVIGRGSVCLDFLESNEKRTNNIFSLSDYERKDLICDMENTQNRIKLLHHYAKSNCELT